MTESAKDAARRLSAPMLDMGFKPVAMHEYRTATGEPIYWRLRLKHPKTGEKWIRPMYANGNGFELKEPEGAKVLYNLDRLSAAPDGSVVIVTEGENKVDALSRLGLLATTTGSASSAGAADWTPLKRHRVRIWRDNDDAGTRYATEVEERLRALGVAVEHVDVDELGLEPKGDVVDWLQVHPGASAEDVLALSLLPSVATSTGGDAAPLPTPLPTLPPVPAFEPKCLPPLLRAYVHDIAERMQCPPDFPAVVALTMIGAAAGRRVLVRPKQNTDWYVTPNLWAMLIGRPGIKKSPALAEALAPLRRLEARAAEQFREEQREHEKQMRIQKMHTDAADAAARKALKDNRNADIRKLLDDPGEPDAPTLTRYIVNDSTVEALGEVLQENPNGVLLERDELTGWLRDLDREGQQSSRAFYLTAADGDKSFTVDRITRGRGRLIPAVCVSIVGNIQPDPLIAYVRETQRGGGGDGLLQRFGLMVFPDIARDFVQVDRAPDAEARAGVAALVERLVALNPASVGAEYDEQAERWFVRFGPEAQRLFDAWELDHERRLRDEDEHPAIAAHLAKYRKLVPALALIDHLASGGRASIAVASMTRALDLADYLEAHGRRVYSVAARANIEAARTLLTRLRKSGLLPVFRARDVYRKCWAGLSTPEDADAALRVLVDFDWLSESSVHTNGRPTREYRAHPTLMAGA